MKRIFVQKDWKGLTMGGELVGGWVGGVEKLILKLTSASTGVEVEAWAELGNNLDFYSF